MYRHGVCCAIVRNYPERVILNGSSGAVAGDQVAVVWNVIGEQRVGAVASLAPVAVRFVDQAELGHVMRRTPTCVSRLSYE